MKRSADLKGGLKDGPDTVGVARAGCPISRVQLEHDLELAIVSWLGR